MGWIPNPTVFLIGSMRVRAVFNNCLAVGTPEPWHDPKKHKLLINLKNFAIIKFGKRDLF